VCSVRVNDQLGVGQVFFKVERVDGVEDDVGFATHDLHRHLDVLEVGESFPNGLPPFLQRCELSRLHLFIDR
jgi:hypothetical protein